MLRYNVPIHSDERPHGCQNAEPLRSEGAVRVALSPSRRFWRPALGGALFLHVLVLALLLLLSSRLPLPTAPADTTIAMVFAPPASERPAPEQQAAEQPVPSTNAVQLKTPVESTPPQEQPPPPQEQPPPPPPQEQPPPPQPSASQAIPPPAEQPSPPAAAPQQRIEAPLPAPSPAPSDVPAPPPTPQTAPPGETNETPPPAEQVEEALPLPPPPAPRPPPRKSEAAERRVMTPRHTAAERPEVAPQQSARPSPVAAPAPPSQPAPAITDAWRQALAAWLAEHKVYPESARERDIEGTVTVRFSLDPSGHVAAVAVVQGSGSRILDKAAEAMVRNATLPPPATQDQITISVQIHYRLTD